MVNNLGESGIPFSAAALYHRAIVLFRARYLVGSGAYTPNGKFLKVKNNYKKFIFFIKKKLYY